MHQVYKVPATKVSSLLLFCLAGLTAAGAAWAFKSGLFWSGIFLIAAAGPFLIFYWYMLSVNPARSSIVVAEQGLFIKAPPFFMAEVAYSDVSRAFTANMKTDERLSFKKTKRMMRFLGYISGRAVLKNGAEAHVLTNKKTVLCLDTSEGYFLLGPAHMDGFMEDLKKKGISIRE